MKISKNVIEVSKEYLQGAYKNTSISNESLNIIPIKGYLTTNVYRMTYSHDSLNITCYIKESCNLEHDGYNKFIEDEYKNTKYIYQNFISNEIISVVKPLIYYPKYNSFFMEEIKGDRLDNVIIRLVLFRKKDTLISIIKSCKNWLHQFQLIELTSDLAGNEYDFCHRELKKIKRIHERTLQNCEDSEVELIDKLYARLHELFRDITISETDITLKHNDFAPWNIMLNGESITVYDFADIQVDYKFYDLIYFVHSLNKLASKVPYNKAVFKLLQETMLEGTDISESTKSYYFMHFYLQDIDSLVRKIKAGGFMSYIYRYKYMTVKNKIIKYLN